MVKRETPPILNGADDKQTINCPHCSTKIDHVEVVQEQHGFMDIGGEIKYDLDADNNGAPRYLCPVCQGEIDDDLVVGSDQAEFEVTK